MSESFHFIDR